MYSILNDVSSSSSATLVTNLLYINPVQVKIGSLNIGHIIKFHSHIGLSVTHTALHCCFIGRCVLSGVQLWDTHNISETGSAAIIGSVNVAGMLGPLGSHSIHFYKNDF